MVDDVDNVDDGNEWIFISIDKNSFPAGSVDNIDL
jgi:hypothetical protein